MTENLVFRRPTKNTYDESTQLRAFFLDAVVTTDLFDSPDSPAAVLIRDPRRLSAVRYRRRSQFLILTSLLLAFPVLLMPAPMWALWLFRGAMLTTGVLGLLFYAGYRLQSQVALSCVTRAALADMADAPQTVAQANHWLRSALRLQAQRC